MLKCKRGDIWVIDLGNHKVGSEQAGCRPCIVVQNNKGNAFSTTTIVCPITSKSKPSLPTHVELDVLEYVSTILCEQIIVVSKDRFKKFLTNIDDMRTIDMALKNSLGLGE